MNKKSEIKKAALVLFDEKGFHATTIRNIAKEVGCSLPMVYYYFDNKDDLFREIIEKDYFLLLEKLSKDLPKENITEYYTTFINRIKALDEASKMIYRLGIKVYLKYEGSDHLKMMMELWEKSIEKRHYDLVKSFFCNYIDIEIRVRLLIKILENTIEKIIVCQDDIDIDSVREEIEFIFKP